MDGSAGAGNQRHSLLPRAMGGPVRTSDVKFGSGTLLSSTGAPCVKEGALAARLEGATFLLLSHGSPLTGSSSLGPSPAGTPLPEKPQPGRGSGVLKMAFLTWTPDQLLVGEDQLLCENHLIESPGPQFSASEAGSETVGVRKRPVCVYVCVRTCAHVYG